MDKTVIFHVPHDGNTFPRELLGSVCIPFDAFMDHHRVMRDTAARAFIPPDVPHKAVVFEVSRLLCDVERFTDGTEPMDAYGMGYCYEKSFSGAVIKRVDAGLRADTLRYYRAHHERLDSSVRGLRGRALLFDLHSFSELILVKELVPDRRPLPDVCVGGDRFLPPRKRDLVLRAFRSAGFSSAFNYPYSGSMVPDCVLSGETDADLVSVMVEVNKTAYLAPDGRPDPASVAKIRAVLKHLAHVL
jgi:N-formylglutamate amidohydrolase